MIKSLLRLYPKAWRERYEEEVARMIDDSGSGLGDVPNLVRGALDAQLHPQPLGLPAGRLRGWFTFERSAGVAAIAAGVGWVASYLALIVFTGRPAQQSDVMRYVAATAVPGLFAAFAIAGLAAQRASDWRVIAVTAVALVGGASASMLAILAMNAATPGVSLVPYDGQEFMQAGTVAVLIGTLVGVVAMWGRGPVGRRWLILLAIASVLDLVLLVADRYLSFTLVLRSAAGGWLGVLVGMAWIGVGGAALQADPRGRARVDDLRSESETSRVRFNWLIALALAAAAFMLYLGIRSAIGSELGSGLRTLVYVLTAVCLWLTPVALAWRIPGLQTMRPALIPGLVLVALPAIAGPLIGALQPIANLSGISSEIRSLLVLVSVAGYLLVGRELLHLAPATWKHRALLAVIGGLTVAPQLVFAAIDVAMFYRGSIGWRNGFETILLPMALAVSQAFALWAPVASAVSRAEPRRFWRPLALVLPATLMVGVMNDVALRSTPTNRLRAAPLISSDAAFVIAECAGMAVALLWLYAFGWHFPGPRAADQPTPEVVATA
jgi:hypothetical protein